MKHTFFVRLFAVIISLSLLPCLKGQELRIEKILDSNLFETADSTLISLANVKTISINDPDSLKREFAEKTIKYGKEHLLGRSFIAERVSKTDSVLFVHLFKELPFTRLSINKEYLLKGYGYFSPDQDSRYFK